jgi:hypothetical protein
MASVYLDAVLNISATTSQDDDQGIFESVAQYRPKSLIFRCSSRRNSDEAEEQNAISSNQKSELVTGLLDVIPIESNWCERNVIHKRGWVHQESILTPRLLSYKLSNMEWACGAVHAAESRPQGWMEQASRASIHNRIFSLSEKWSYDENHPRKTQLSTQLDWWYSKMNIFINLELTFPSDRIPAITGLARAFASKTGLTFRCGFWVEDILRGLLWTGPTSSRYEAHHPTWSWGRRDKICRSYDNYNTYDTVSLGLMGNFFNTRLISLPKAFKCEQQTTCVLSLYGYTQLFHTLWPDHYFNQLRGRGCAPKTDQTIVILGTRRIDHRAWTEYLWCLKLGTHMPERIGRVEQVTHEIWLDTPLIIAEVPSFLNDRYTVVLRLANFSNLYKHSSWSTYYLILQPVPDSPNTFRRAGIMRAEILQDSGPSTEPTTIDSAYELKTVHII